MSERTTLPITRRAALRNLGLLTGGVLVACSGSGSGKGEPGDDAGTAPDGTEGTDGADATDGMDATGSPDASNPGHDASACTPTRRDATGPFFEAGAPQRVRIIDDEEPGERLFLEGTVLGPDCETPIAGALLDIWQADASGQYHDASSTEYRLRGQVLTDATGRWMLETVIPGHYENGPGAWRPAHIHFTVSAPGHATVTTQLYFAGDPYLAPNDGCPDACDSGDPDRIVALEASEGVSVGTWRVVLARA